MWYSVRRGREVCPTPLWMQTTLGLGRLPWVQTPRVGQTPQMQTPSGLGRSLLMQTTLGWANPPPPADPPGVGQTSPMDADTPSPPYSQQAGGTHPTVMHTCSMMHLVSLNSSCEQTDACENISSRDFENVHHLGGLFWMTVHIVHIFSCRAEPKMVRGYLICHTKCRTLDCGFEANTFYLNMYVDKKAWLPCWPSRGQQVLRQRSIWWIQCMMKTKHSSKRSTLAVKRRTDITWSPKTGYNGLTKRTDPLNILLKNYLIEKRFCLSDNNEGKQYE